MSKHTPGKWSIIADNEISPAIRYTVMTDTASSVADVYARVWKDGKLRKDPEAKANAQLISAAPDLLKSVNELVEIVKSEFEGLDQSAEEVMPWSLAVQRANAAIEQATKE